MKYDRVVCIERKRRKGCRGGRCGARRKANLFRAQAGSRWVLTGSAVVRAYSGRRVLGCPLTRNHSLVSPAVLPSRVTLRELAPDLKRCAVRRRRRRPPTTDYLFTIVPFLSCIWFYSGRTRTVASGNVAFPVPTLPLADRKKA